MAAPAVLAQQQQKVLPPVPQPGVPEIFSIEGEYVRVAYNNEGFLSLGYRVANENVGKEWILLEMGATLRDGVPNYTLKREHLQLQTPDGKMIPMPTQSDYLNADLRSQEMRAQTNPDSINYFPPSARDACRIGFFSPQGARTMSYNEVELSPRRGCVGRVYFKIPGGLKYGQHFLVVQFAKSVVKAPFRIVTPEEAKTLSREWKDIKKELEKVFKGGGN
jgi:hypothetical protein